MTARLAGLAGLLACLPALLLVLAVGPIPSPDTAGYWAYVAELGTGLPTGEALLRGGAAPPSLYRAPGYPLLLATLGPWGAALLGIGLFGLLCGGVAWLAGRLGLPRWLALACGALPGVSTAAPFIASLLPDGMAVALMGFAWLGLTAAAAGFIAATPAALAAGLFFAGATLFREATPYVALFSLPLALLAPGAWPRRALRAGLVLLLPLAVLAGLAAWNQARAGVSVATTSRQVVMVQALLPLLRAGMPLYDGASLYDRIARESLGRGSYDGIRQMNERLFSEAGMTAPEMAAEASRRYAETWRAHPAAMLGATLGRVDASLFATPFDPAASAAVVAIHLGWDRPEFDRLTPLLRAARHGDAGAIATIVAVMAPRIAGMALGIAALVVPLLLYRRRRDRMARALLGLWFATFSLAALYLPVHIEPRYLAPLLSFVPLLAVSWWLGRTPPRQPTSSGRSAG